MKQAFRILAIPVLSFCLLVVGTKLRITQLQQCQTHPHRKQT